MFSQHVEGSGRIGKRNVRTKRHAKDFVVLSFTVIDLLRNLKSKTISL